MIEDEGKYYLYRHIRLDKNEVFYVGIGTKYHKNPNSKTQEYSRAYSKSSRNFLWNSITNKSLYKVEIVLESNDYDFIQQKEIEYIALYGRKIKKEGYLVNISSGGFKDLEFANSGDSKIKTNKTRKERKHPIEVREKIRKSLTGQSREGLRKYYDIYDLEGNPILTEKTVKEVALFIGVSCDTIRHATSKTYKILKKYYSVISGSIFDITLVNNNYCKFKDCAKKKFALGYCNYHYYHESERVKERINNNNKKRNLSC